MVPSELEDRSPVVILGGVPGLIKDRSFVQVLRESGDSISQQHCNSMVERHQSVNTEASEPIPKDSDITDIVTA